MIARLDNQYDIASEVNRHDAVVVFVGGSRNVRLFVRLGL